MRGLILALWDYDGDLSKCLDAARERLSGSSTSQVLVAFSTASAPSLCELREYEMRGLQFFPVPSKMEEVQPRSARNKLLHQYLNSYLQKKQELGALALIRARIASSLPGTKNTEVVNFEEEKRAFLDAIYSED